MNYSWVISDKIAYRDGYSDDVRFNRVLVIEPIREYDILQRPCEIIRYEIREEWCSFEDPVWQERGFQVRRDKCVRFLSFTKKTDAYFFLTLLVTVFNAPKDNLFSYEVSSIMKKIFVQAHAQMTKILKQEEAQPVDEQNRARQLYTGHHVYIFHLSNGTTKIGKSVNVINRARAVQSHSGLIIGQWACSEGLTGEKANQIEADCHRHFAIQRIRGEFFNITFDEACVYLQERTGRPLVFGRIEKR